MGIAAWLSDINEEMRDPRLGNDKEDAQRQREERVKENGSEGGVRSRGVQEERDDGYPYMQFQALNTWIFTVGDVGVILPFHTGTSRKRRMSGQS